jgi:hypothetical protein
VRSNQPSSTALAEALAAGLAEDDPAVLAMRACLNRAEREARDKNRAFDQDESARFASDDELDASVFASEARASRSASVDARFEKTFDAAEPSASPPEENENESSVVGRGSLLGGPGAHLTLRVVELVGEGAYGRVMRCVDAASESRFCAVKEFKIYEKDPDVEEVRRTSEREVRALRSLDHPNIVRHLGDFYQNDKLYVAMEFVPRTLLQILQAAERDDEMRDDGPKRSDDTSDDETLTMDVDERSTSGGLPAEDVRRYVHQLCLALTYLHARGYVYRDVKPENLLVGDDGVLKLCDFGFARELPGTDPGVPGGGAADANTNAPLTDYVATRWYRASAGAALPRGGRRGGRDARRVRAAGGHVGGGVFGRRASRRRADVPRRERRGPAAFSAEVFGEAHSRPDDGVQREPAQRRRDLSRGRTGRAGGIAGGAIRRRLRRRRARFRTRLARAQSQKKAHGRGVFRTPLL